MKRIFIGDYIKAASRIIHQKRTVSLNLNYLSGLFANEQNELQFFLLNDDVIISFFGFNSDGSIPFSIIGIYVTFVYTIGRFARLIFDKISQRVIYEEIPNPDPLLELCEGVYIYRNQRKEKKENELYDLLIRIYRSPETMIKITGAKLEYPSSENKQ